MTEGSSDVAPIALATDQVSLEFPANPGVTRSLGHHRVVHAVTEVSFALPSRSATALVGESGSGKSTLARLLAGLYRPTRGEVHLEGSVVNVRSLKAFRTYAKHVQLILQDPYASLNPHRTIGYHVTRPLKIHGYVTRRTPRHEVVAEACRLLEQVGLTPGENFYYRFPHELSGGQRQRASIARALAARPRVLIADEPVSMLDVSLRRGILELLRDLKEKGLTILYITHDLPSAAYFAETIAVMYAGKIVEQGPAHTVINEPAHPYTQLLLSATPDPFAPAALRGVDGVVVRGEPPSLIDLPSGCPFHVRCPHAFDKCRAEAPSLRPVALGHSASCWLHDRSNGAHGLPSPLDTQTTAGISPESS
jgi:peptide/nickel transport system ATP-binding protein